MIAHLDAAEVLNLSCYGSPRAFPDYTIRQGVGVIIRVPDGGLTLQHLFRSEKAGNRISRSTRWQEADTLNGGEFLFQFHAPQVPQSFGEYVLEDDENAAPAALIAVAQLCCYFRGLADPLGGFSSWAAESTAGYRLVVGWASGRIVPTAVIDNLKPTYVGLATFRRLD